MGFAPDEWQHVAGSAERGLIELIELIEIPPGMGGRACCTNAASRCVGVATQLAQVQGCIAAGLSA